MISVVVCTCNRAARLPEFFEALRRLTVPDGLKWELIVVDNASKDATKDCIVAEHARGGLPLKYVLETQRGLGAARNAGLRNAVGAIIAMTDDDCFVAPDWLATLSLIFADSGVDVVGGRVLLHNPRDFPVTIRLDDGRHEVATFQQLFSTVPGCNLAFRRGVVEQIGGFDPALGAGLPITAEDSDFVYRAIKAGCRVVYDGRLTVSHDHGRRTKAAVQSLNRSYVMGRGALYAKHWLSGDKDALRYAYWEVIGLLRRCLTSSENGQERIDSLRDVAHLFRGAAIAARNRALKGAHRMPHPVQLPIDNTGQ